MKIKKTKIKVWIILLIIFLDLSGFYLINFPSQIYSYIRWNRLLLALLGIFLCLINFPAIKYKLFPIRIQFLDFYSGIVLISCVILCVGSIFLNNTKNIVTLLSGCSPYLLVFLTYYFVLVLDRSGDIDYVLKKIDFIMFIWYALLIVQSYLYRRNNIIFLNLLKENNTVWERDYGIRIGLGSIGNIMILYNFYKLTKKFSYRFLLLFLLGVATVLFVQQTRMYTITIACSIISIFISSGKFKSKRIIRGIYVLGILFILYGLGIFDYFIASFSMHDAATGRNTEIRLDAIAYYWKCFVREPIIGMGITTDLNILNGSLGIYSTTDVGVIGLLAQTGLLSIVFWLIPLIRMKHIINRMKRKRENTCGAFPFMNGIFTFAVISSISLIFTDSTRAILIPFMLSIFEFENYKLQCQGRK